MVPIELFQTKEFIQNGNVSFKDKEATNLIDATSYLSFRQ